jgi:dolichyl-phosphate-mannose-protein mannosyltransferase
VQQAAATDRWLRPSADAISRPLSTTWTRADWILLAVVTLVAGALRVVGVTRPGEPYFDEFYAGDACWYVKASSTLCGVPKELTPMHPPLGKWAISIGIQLFGFQPIGWRFSSVVAGTLTVALLYLLARRLLRSTLAASLTAGLLGIDFLHFVQSRVAMLDVFLTLFTVAAFLFAVYDRDQRRASLARPKPVLGGRGWRLAAGVACGAAVATKWSGLSALFAVVVLTLFWEVQRRRGHGLREAFRSSFSEEAGSVIVCLALIPAAVYVASYVGRLDGALLAWPWVKNSWVRDFFGRQKFMFLFHVALDQPHPSASAAWTWPLLKRPVVLYLDRPGRSYVEVMATGSPLAWWGAILAVGYTAWRGLRARRLEGAEIVIVCGVVSTYGSWLLLEPARSLTFLYYMLPTVPFMCLALGYAGMHAVHRPAGRAAMAAFAVGAVALFAFYYPILAAVPLNEQAWRSRILFSDCKPQKLPASVDTTHGAPPPSGWCWR